MNKNLFMEKRNTLLLTLMIVLGFSFQAQAALQYLGTDTLGNRLIYDTDLDITWYDYTRFGYSWSNQSNWASNLTVNFGSNAYDDWRLPGNAGCTGFNCTGSEMGHLYYTELGNLAGGSLTNTGDFLDLGAGSYWTNTQVSLYHAYYFNFSGGFQGYADVGHEYSAIAVRDGMAVAPEPLSSILIVTGGVFLAGRRFIRRKE